MSEFLATVQDDGGLRLVVFSGGPIDLYNDDTTISVPDGFTAVLYDDNTYSLVSNASVGGPFNVTVELPPARVGVA